MLTRVFNNAVAAPVLSLLVLASLLATASLAQKPRTGKAPAPTPAAPATIRFARDIRPMLFRLSEDRAPIFPQFLGVLARLQHSFHIRESSVNLPLLTLWYRLFS